MTVVVSSREEGGRAAASPAARRAGRLGIGGWVRRPMMLDAPQLGALDGMEVRDFDVACARDGSHRVLPAHAGPFALLARHDLATGPR